MTSMGNNCSCLHVYEPNRKYFFSIFLLICNYKIFSFDFIHTHSRSQPFIHTFIVVPLVSYLLLSPNNKIYCEEIIYPCQWKYTPQCMYVYIHRWWMCWCSDSNLINTLTLLDNGEGKQTIWHKLHFVVTYRGKNRIRLF